MENLIGGAGVKKSAIKIKKPTVKTIVQKNDVPKTVLENAYQIVSTVSNTTEMHPHNFMTSMSIDRLMKMKDYLINNKSQIDKKLDKMSEFTEQSEILSEAIKQLEDSKARFAHVVKEGMSEHYDDLGSLLDDVDQAIDFKVKESQKASSSMEV